MKVDLLGTSFTLQSDESPEYLDKVVAFYSQKLEEIRSSVETEDPVKLGILAGILVADELFKTRERSAEGLAEDYPSPALQFSLEELDEAERITLELIDRIGNSIDRATQNAGENDNEVKPPDSN